MRTYLDAVCLHRAADVGLDDGRVELHECPFAYILSNRPEEAVKEFVEQVKHQKKH